PAGLPDLPGLPGLPDPPDPPALHVGEFVADAPYGQQEPRICRIRLDAAAQALHARADAAAGDERVAAPDLRQERLAAEHDAGVRRQQMQQPELLVGELHLAAVDADTPARRIDLDAVDQDRRLGRIVSRGRGGLARAAEQRTRARHQFADAGRLRQVVVGAALEAEHLVALLAPCGQHQNRDVLVLTAAPHGAAERDAVEARDHQVEHQQIEAFALGPRERLLAVGQPFTGVALESEMQAHELTNVPLVFDDEHARRQRHGFFTIQTSAVHSAAVQSYVAVTHWRKTRRPP